MARRWSLGRRPPRDGDAPLVASSAVVDLSPGGAGFKILREGWQKQAWGYYRTQGEYRYAIDWEASALSRVRLRAATMVPGADEPEIIDDGIAAEIVAAIGGGTSGQAAMMSRFTVLLQVPGDSYGLVTGDPVNGSSWDVHSAETVKVSGSTMQVQTGPGTWETVPPDTVKVRVWNSDSLYPWLATSPSQAAVPILDEIDLYNREIVSTLTSRLASRGIIVIPQEISFPGLANNANAPNALATQLIEIGQEAIRNPGSAGAAIPFVVEVPAQYADAIRHMRIDTEMSSDVVEKRDRALIRLATTMNIPTEVSTGSGGMNHWGAWQMEDSAIKIHLSPIAETICGGITTGYLRPALRVVGWPEERVMRTVVWYDLSELKQKPDSMGNAVQIFDRMELSGAALREAGGMDESSAPTEEERTTQILTRLAYNGQMITDALTQLSGIPSSPAPAPGVPPTDDTASTPPDAPDAGAGSSVPDTIADIPEFNGR